MDVIRFFYRLSRNLICSNRVGRNILFKREKLAQSFGKGSGEYSWRVFNLHKTNLELSGFKEAVNILEIGPGRNLGTSLLWWIFETIKNPNLKICITLYDYYENISFEKNSISVAAKMLKNNMPENSDPKVYLMLTQMENNEIKPNFRYIVGKSNKLEIETIEKYDLVYSHACLEHIWEIETFYEQIFNITRKGGFHSHRIDLADHGRRNTNYIEMLKWSEFTYWLTMRNIPGAINRLRANDHLNIFKKNNFNILFQKRDKQEKLPAQHRYLAKKFKSYSIDDILTTGIEIVSQKN